MSLLVSYCPRCGANAITFDVKAQVYWRTQYGWQHWYEIFCVCRGCRQGTIFVVHLNVDGHQNGMEKICRPDDGLVSYTDALNPYFDIDHYISLRDEASQKSPEHVPQEIEKAFNEGAACLSIRCNNAGATMFRLCVDLATRPLLPDPGDATKPQANSKTRRDLGLRLTWLFENAILPPALRELAKCIREDANDGAHVGNLSKADAEDLLDFTTTLLERLFTEPKKLELAEERRTLRRT